jgi:hypothetical protein
MTYAEALMLCRKGKVIRRPNWPKGSRLRLIGGTLMLLIGNRKSERYNRTSLDAIADDWEAYNDH